MQLRSGSEFVVGEELRALIARSNGVICTPESIFSNFPGKLVISVGDVTTAVLHEKGIRPFIEIVDLKTKRGQEGEFQSVAGSFKISNRQGTLSHDLFLLIEKLLKEGGGRIEVDGEEDLAVIPIIFYSDENTVVAYGIPDVGMACIEVSGEIKNFVNDLIERMEVRCQN